MSTEKINCISITFSPRELNEDQIEKIKNWIIFMKGTPSENSKILSLEHQGKYHLQGGFISDKRTDNIRRSFIKIINWNELDEDEQKHSLKIKRHDNWKYLVGYCQKEGNILYTNIDETIVHSYHNYYENQLAKLNQVKNEQKFICTGLNSLLRSCYIYCENEGKNPLKYTLRSLVVELVAYGKLPFSMGRKIKQSDEQFWNAYRNVQLTGEPDIEKIITTIEKEDRLILSRVCKFCR